MKKIVIIDDEPLARSIVCEYLANYADLEVVAECNNGYEGVKAIMQHKPDLVFLDIQMPKINGFEMLELLDTIPPVIFATAFDEYAIKAFEANAVDYLLKPFSKERFGSALDKWRSKTPSAAQAKVQELLESSERQPEEKNRIVVKTNSEITIVPVNEVVYMEAYDDYVKIFTKDTYYLKKKTMNYYEQTLDPELFFRTHRSFIINLQQLTRIEPMEKNSYVALLKTGKKIPLSRQAYRDLKEKLGI
jgi:two-component system LytT family response regulator